RPAVHGGEGADRLLAASADRRPVSTSLPTFRPEWRRSVGGWNRAMLRLALGYLAIVIVAAIGFSSLPERSPPKRPGALERHVPEPPAAEEDVAHEPAEDDDDAYVQYIVEPGPGGHYVIEALVNGTPVQFLVDTGASDIVLTMEDAERIGLHPRTLRFTRRFATANGEVRGAPVILREIRVGQFSLFDVSASVNEAPLPVSLLGMSFLGRLNGYQVENGRLVLNW